MIEAFPSLGRLSRPLPRNIAKGLIALTVSALLACAVSAQRGPDQPETASGTAAKSLATASRQMVAAANPYAVDAGLEILRAGGSAIDSAIATQLVLALVEPQSSGLGGGAFILHWHKASRTLAGYDGRETAPASAREDRFLTDGKPLAFDKAAHSGLSVGVPGLVRLMEHVHKIHGRLPWARLFDPAIRLAEGGFQVSLRLNLLLRWQGARNFDDTSRRYFFDERDSARAAGSNLKNPEFAASLRAIAEKGSSAFYAGPIAQEIVAAVARAPNAPGDMELDDLAGYAIQEREPVCVSYRADRICGMGPPSSGGIAVAQTMKLIEPFDLGSKPEAAMNAPALHLIAEAERLAYADRERYLADPAFSLVPAGLIDTDYLATRRKLIDVARAMANPEPGSPPGVDATTYGIDATQENPGTSHISIIDADGNAIAMTTTIEGAFGARIMAAGFLLNNELTDFSFRPRDEAGRPIANRVEGGKRPRSSMAPTIVFDTHGEVKAVLGSPGGERIPLYVIKTLVALLEWKLDAQAAAALPNFGSRGATFEIELGGSAVWTALKVKPYGHAISTGLMTSGLHVIVRRNGALEGGADPRREGIAKGD